MIRKVISKKIAVIGAGAVGSTIAYSLMIKGLVTEIILIDVNKEKERGEVLDIGDALSFSDTSNIKNGEYTDARDADIIILTAGVAQKEGETRLDLVEKNKIITTSVMKSIGKIKESSIILVVSNPVDILTYLVQEISGLPHTQVFGTGTSLDTARLRTIIAHNLNVDSKQVEGFVLGEHGDNEFVAWSTVSVAGKSIKEILSEDDMVKISNEVKNEVYEIIKEKGATFYGISMVVTDIVEAILLDEHRVLPVSYRVADFNGVSDICLGATAIIGVSGIVKPWQIELADIEKDLLKKSAGKIKEYI